MQMMKKNADDLYPFYILFIFLMFLNLDSLNKYRPRTALSIHLLVLNPVLYTHICVQPKLFAFNNQIDKLNAGSDNRIFRNLTQCLLNWLSVARSSYKNSK